MTVYIIESRNVMENTATFEKDIKVIIDNERIGEAGIKKPWVKFDITTDEYNYRFSPNSRSKYYLHYVLSYDVSRIKKIHNTFYDSSFEKYTMFNDFIVEVVGVRMINGVFVFGYFETLSFKQNSCKLCNDLVQDIRTFRSYKRHQKSKGHIKNVAFSSKIYADTIADITNLNDDVIMHITSYLF